MKIWLDVGANKGEWSSRFAKKDKNLTVYAFEPNPTLAKKLKRRENYIVIQSAVSDKNGYAGFYLCSDNAASSLLPFTPQGLKEWVSPTELKTTQIITVPTVRLDTFMQDNGIRHVDFLKIDTQGTDLNVVKSAGERLKDIDLITLEVITTPYELYRGENKKAEVLAFMQTNSFRLIAEDKNQSYGQAENLTFGRMV